MRGNFLADMHLADGRTIEINDDDLCVKAFDGETEVGCLSILEPLETDMGPDGPYRVYQIHIDAEYRYNGIGPKLYEEAFKLYGQMAVDDQDPMDENYPTPEGMVLIRKMISKGYLYPLDIDIPK